MSFTLSPMTIALRRTTAGNGVRAAGLTPLVVIATLWLALPIDQAQAQDTQPARMAAPGTIGCPDGWKPVPPGVNPALRCLPDYIVAKLPPGRLAPEQPIGCPEGWQPVSPNLNPVLRCQPTRIAAKSPAGTRAPEQPIGCPKGWKPVPPGVNPVLRCLPNEIAAMPPAGRAVPPPGCPKGWKPVPPGVNPVMRCLPGNVAPQSSGSPSEVRRYDIVGAFPKKLEGEDAQSITGQVKPQQGDRDPGGPGQGRDTQQQGQRDPGGPGQGRDTQQQGQRDPGGPGQGRDAQQAKFALPDLALIGAFQLGGATIPWGTSAAVSADDAAFKKMGACGFRYLYRTRNQGPIGAAATSNRILRDTQNGPVLATKALPALAAGAVAVSDGHVSLKSGTWMLYVHADAPAGVAESDEANNLRRVRVTVEGDCG